MKKLRLLVIGAFALAGSGPVASASTHLDLFWAPTYNLPGYASGVNFVGLGGGAEFDLAQVLSVGVNYLYRQHSFGAAAANDSTVPVTLRIKVGKIVIIEAGGYGSYFTTSPFSSAINYGLRGGALVHLPLGPKVGLLLGADYDYGLANVSPNMTLSDVTFTAGLRIGLGGAIR